MPEIRARYFATELRISSAVLVQAKGAGFVPGVDPSSDVVLEGSHADVDAAADELVGDEAEPPFDLVDPERSGRGDVDVEPGMAFQPVVDHVGLAGGELMHTLLMAIAQPVDPTE